MAQVTETPLSTSLPQKAPRFLPRLWVAVAASLKHLPTALLHDRVVAAFLLLYFLVKLGVNLALNASPLTALRSPLMGLLVYALAAVLIDAVQLFRFGKLEDLSTRSTAWQRPSPVRLGLLLAFWAFWFAVILDSLQHRSLAPGAPLLGFLPGWEVILSLLDSSSAAISQAFPLWSPAYAHNLLLNLFFWGILPGAALLILFRKQGFRWADLGLSFQNVQAAAPFLILLLAAYLSNGISPKSLAFLAYALLYPGLVEELFNRGLLQRAFAGWLRPTHTILAASLLFGSLHIPEYFFHLYAHDPLMTLGGVFDVILAGLFLGYGFMRTGSVLPWAAIHALMDVVGI